MTDLLTLRVSRVVAAPREAVFRSFTDPASLVRWFGPPGGSCTVAEMDPQPGGMYRVAMHTAEGHITYLVGTYQEVRAPERLVFTWLWEGMGIEETLVTIELSESDDDGTHIAITHERFPSEESVRFHEWGWEGTLGRMVEMFGGGKK